MGLQLAIYLTMKATASPENINAIAAKKYC
jgi:hypothetical protein